MKSNVAENLRSKWFPSLHGTKVKPHRVSSLVRPHGYILVNKMAEPFLTLPNKVNTYFPSYCFKILAHTTEIEHGGGLR